MVKRRLSVFVLVLSLKEGVDCLSVRGVFAWAWSSCLKKKRAYGWRVGGRKRTAYDF